MKKKILALMLTVCMIVPCMAALTACGGDGATFGHTHTWAEKYTYNATQHWKKCVDCDETTDKENHELTDGLCSVCGYVDSTKVAPQKQAMSKYFSGVKATYEKETAVDSDGEVKDFKTLVDRQIDVLAQDLLARLNYVYGDLRKNNISNWGKSYILADANDPIGDYRYYGKYGKGKGVAAYVETTALLTTLRDESFYNAVEDGSAKLKEININSVDDYQKSLIISNTSNNYLAHSSVLCLIGAINGGSMKIDSTGYMPFDTDPDKTWLVTNLTSEETKKSLKLSIAQGITKNEDTDYDSVISEINELGFGGDIKKTLEDIIYNSIIGNRRVSEDKGYYDVINADYDGIINFANCNTINTDARYNANNSPRLFKGYNIVVPAIVKAALNNKFDNTDVPVFPAFSKTAVAYTNNAEGFNEAQNYETITLLAKANTPYTKLAMKISGSNIVGESVKLKYQVYVNGERKGAMSRIDLTNDEQIIEIDKFKERGKKFSAYSGNKISDLNMNIFENSVVADSDTDGYIKIVFTNDSGVKFKVTFDGYYDKV